MATKIEDHDLPSWREMQLESLDDMRNRPRKRDFVIELQLAEECTKAEMKEVQSTVDELNQKLCGGNISQNQYKELFMKLNVYRKRLNDPHTWWTYMQTLYTKEASYLVQELTNLTMSLTDVTKNRFILDALQSEWASNEIPNLKTRYSL